MTDKAGHNDKHTPDHREVFNQFPDEQTDTVQKVWKMSARAVPDHPNITENDVEAALSNVHKRIDNGSTVHRSSPRSSTVVHNWRWFVAAAVILLIFGAGILLVPKTVNAPYGEVASVTLPDGSMIELNSGSQLRYNRLFSFTNRTVRLNGEAFFSVRNGNHPFIVNANNATVEVTGTKFNVRSWRGDPGRETEVTVSEGSVLFYPLDFSDRSVTITPGQSSRWTTQMDEPTVPEEVKTDRVLGWRENMLMFNDKSLNVIFNELERRFDVTIQLEDTAFDQETLTIYYAEPKNVETVIKDICRVKGLRYAETANGFRIYR